VTLGVTARTLASSIMPAGLVHQMPAKAFRQLATAALAGF